PGPEGEPQPGNTPVSFPPQGSVAVPPPTAFYPGNGVTPPPQVMYQSVPVPNRIQRKVFKVPDTANPSMPIQICPAPPPLFRRIGLAIGYWEPMALTDVTRSPGCMVNLGFS
ncbi:TraU family protein, partial [Escherichia coli]|nr:TraU family protein [Escherichia coli]